MVGSTHPTPPHPMRPITIPVGWVKPTKRPPSNTMGGFHPPYSIPSGSFCSAAVLARRKTSVTKVDTMTMNSE